MRGAQGNHLTRAELADLLAGRLGRPRIRELIAHLFGGCAACRKSLRGFVALGAPVAPAGKVDAYELPFARAFARAREEAERLAMGRIEAWLDLAALIGPERRPPSSGSPHKQWAWCEVLLEAASERRKHQPADAADLAALAMAAAEQLTGGPYPADVLADLQARAHMEYGNLLRIIENLDGSEHALGTAQSKLLAGTGDPRLTARLLDLLGSLYRAQRRFGEAVEALHLAAQAYQASEEPHLAGRSLLKAGIAVLYNSEPEQALRRFEHASMLLDPRRDPALFLAVVHNLLLAQAEAGQATEAARMLWRVRSLYKRHGTAADRTRLMGLEAKIALGLGQLERAENLFRREKAGFEEAGQHYVASVVGLDLAAVLLDLGRPAEVLDLVGEMLEVFRDLRIEREALVAVLLLHQALLQGEATAALARKVAADLRRLDLRPTAPSNGQA